MTWKITAVVLAILAVMITVVIVVGDQRWQAETTALTQRMEASRHQIRNNLYHESELDGLPAPVQRYFRAVLKDGRPFVTTVHIEHEGTFNMSETGEDWKAFRSKQFVTIQRPAFVWDARIRMAPGLTAYVHDAYIAGEGILTAKLFGLFTVMQLPNTPELANGELMRFFAEAAWYPTALLPSNGVVWEALDNSTAAATLTDGTVTVKLVFTFDDQGLIRSVRSDGRYRLEDGKPIATPWQGRVWNYRSQDGLLVPLDGEVEWLLPDGPKPYWRGHIKHIEYEPSRR